MVMFDISNQWRPEQNLLKLWWLDVFSFVSTISSQVIGIYISDIFVSEKREVKKRFLSPGFNWTVT